MEYLPVNLKRFYIDVLVAGCVVLFVFLSYMTGKAQTIAANIIANSAYDEDAAY